MGTMAGPGSQQMVDLGTGVLMQQKFDLMDVFMSCLKRNRYKVTNDQGWNSDGIKDFTLSPYKSAPQIFKAKEESDTCCRICCQKNREFDMFIRQGDNGDGPHSLHLHRPFKCSILCCCKLFNPQELTVMDGADQPIGSVVQDFRCIEACCLKAYWKVLDNQGNPQFFYRDNLCSTNSCAPNCLCAVHHIDILDANGGPTDGYLRNIFPGCNFKAMFSGMRDSYHLKFPSNASPLQKNLLFGGLFLIEYMLFEKNQNDDGVGIG